jgi:hypothetical protein
MPALDCYWPVYLACKLGTVESNVEYLGHARVARTLSGSTAWVQPTATTCCAQAEDILMLRSIKDVNAPKFLAPDIPLFEGILADLFPGAASIPHLITSPPHQTRAVGKQSIPAACTCICHRVALRRTELQHASTVIGRVHIRGMAPAVSTLSGTPVQHSDAFTYGALAGIELPEADYKDLDAALQSNCAAANLQPVPAFIEKAHQLYEMILVRHGLMVVGLSYGAKTSIYRCEHACYRGKLRHTWLMPIRQYATQHAICAIGSLHTLLCIKIRNAENVQNKCSKWR